MIKPAWRKGFWSTANSLGVREYLSRHGGCWRKSLRSRGRVGGCDGGRDGGYVGGRVGGCVGGFVGGLVGALVRTVRDLLFVRFVGVRVEGALGGDTGPEGDVGGIGRLVGGEVGGFAGGEPCNDW